MPEVFVEKISDFAEGDRRLVFHDGLEIGVFHWQGNFYAYQNLCLHQGGPCCEGVIMNKVEDVLGPDKTWLTSASPTTRRISSVPGMATNMTSRPANARAIAACA